MKKFHKIDFWIHNILMFGFLFSILSTLINGQFADNYITSCFLISFVTWELLVIYHSKATSRKVINIIWFAFGFISLVASSYFFFGLAFISAPIVFLVNFFFSWIELSTSLDENIT